MDDFDDVPFQVGVAALLEPAPLGGCWSCGRLECPEPDGIDCHEYVASVELGEEIP